MAFALKPKVIDGCLVFQLPTGHYLVQSKSDPEGFRWVGPAYGEMFVLHCSCEGFEYRHECRHIAAVSKWSTIPAVT